MESSDEEATSLQGKQLFNLIFRILSGKTMKLSQLENAI